MEELYRQYGQLMIEAEITQAKINAVKQQIATELNKEIKQDATTSNPESKPIKA
jgi:hypothetical protein